MVATVDEIVTMARSVKERAKDLRAMEVLGARGGGYDLMLENVSGTGDTGASAWEKWEGLYNLERDGVDTGGYGTEFDYLPEYFEKLADASKYDYDLVLSDLQAASDALGTKGDEVVESNELKEIQGFSDDWYGSFANAFRGKFAKNLQYIRPNQKLLIDELAATVKGHWNIVEGARESLLSIASDTEKALRNALTGGKFEGNYMSDGNFSEANTLGLAVTGTALAITGAVTATGTLGLSLAILGAIQAGGSLANTASGIELEDRVEPEPTSIAGDTVDEIISNMDSAISKLSERIAGEEQFQYDELQKTIDSIDKQLSLEGKGEEEEDDAYKLQPFRPALADDVPVPGSDQFGHTR